MSDVSLSDIGKSVLVRGEPGYNLLGIKYSPGGLVATVVPQFGYCGLMHFDLDAITSTQPSK